MIKILHIIKPRRRDVIVATVFFLAGVVLTFFISSAAYNAEVETNRSLTLDIIDNCIGSIEAGDALVNNCSDAYSEVAQCFSNLENCDMEESEKRLAELNAEKSLIQEKLKTLTEEMDSIIATIKMASPLPFLQSSE